MITLDEMSSSEFQKYYSFAIKNFADEHIKANNCSEKEAMAKAKMEYNHLLPEGEKTPNNSFFTIRYKNQEVGMVWFGKTPDEKGFIYDINIWEGYQGHGYGSQAMKKIESIAKNLGIKSIKLHVFGHNKVARNLYEKLGYIETNIIMNKKL